MPGTSTSLLGPFASYEKNEVFLIQPLFLVNGVCVCVCVGVGVCVCVCISGTILRSLNYKVSTTRPELLALLSPSIILIKLKGALSSLPGTNVQMLSQRLRPQFTNACNKPEILSLADIFSQV